MLDADAVAREFEGRNEALISAFDITSDGHCIWASDNRGGMCARRTDERADPAACIATCASRSSRRADGSPTPRRSAASRSTRPTRTCAGGYLTLLTLQIVATAHLARDVRLFDVRSLQEMPSSQDYDEVNEAALKTSFTHGLACSSAYWDPSGSRLLTTSYDSVCRVFHLDAGSLTDSPPDPLAPASSIPHDNKCVIAVSRAPAHLAEPVASRQCSRRDGRRTPRRQRTSPSAT